MGHHAIRNDSTGIKIRYRGFPPVSFQSGLMLIAVLLFSGMFMALVIQGFVASAPDEWYLRIDWIWRALMLVAIAIGLLLLVFVPMIWIGFSDSRFWKRAEWDTSGEQFSGTYAGWFRRTINVSRRFDEIKGIEAVVGVEGETAIDMHVTISGRTLADVSIDLAIDEVNTRDEALDVLFCIARVSGLSHYRVDENDVESMVVSLSHVGGAGSEPVPEASQSPRYELDQVSTSATAPKPRVPRFTPRSFTHPEMRITKWEPGEEIRFLRPATTLVPALIVATIAAVIAGVLAFAFRSDFLHPISSGTLLIVTAFIAGMIGCRIFKHEYEVVLNWSFRTVSWRRDWFTRTTGLDNIDHLELRVIEREHPNDLVDSDYLCKMELITDGGRRIFVVANGSRHGSESYQRQQLEPLTAALAESIGRPWRWVPFKETVVKRGLMYVGAVVTLIGIFSAAFLLLYEELAESWTEADYSENVKQVEATGAKLIRTGIHLNDYRIFGDGYLITVTDPEFDDGDLERLLKMIDKFPSYGLDLSGTKISDDAVKHFIDRTSMRVLIARGTALTSTSVPTIAKTHIRCLDIRDTAIQLDDLKHWTEFDTLLALYISDTDITSQDIGHVYSPPHLDYILVNDEPTTNQVLMATAPETASEAEKVRYFESHLRVAPSPQLDEELSEQQ